MADRLRTFIELHQIAQANGGGGVQPWLLDWLVNQPRHEPDLPQSRIIASQPQTVPLSVFLDIPNVVILNNRRRADVKHGGKR